MLFHFNNKKKLVVDKIIELKDISFIICYWKGSYDKVWSLQTLPARQGVSSVEVWMQELPKSRILCFGFSLDEHRHKVVIQQSFQG